MGLGSLFNISKMKIRWQLMFYDAVIYFAVIVFIVSAYGQEASSTSDSLIAVLATLACLLLCRTVGGVYDEGERMNTFFSTIMSPGICSGVGISIICTLGPLNDREDSAMIHFLYSNKEVICLFCLLWIAFSFILDNLLKKKDENIALLKEENAGLQKVIEQKDDQLKETHKILYNRYGEFARFANSVRFEEVLKQFVDKKTIVDSAQIYKITRNKEYSRIVITLNHVKDYCKAGLDINSLLQTKFVLKYDVYKMFRRGVFRKWNRLKNEDLKSWEAAELYNEILLR